MLGRFIARVASAFSTRTAIAVAFLWSILPFAFPQWQTVILYVSAGIVQLVALPLLAWQNEETLRRHDDATTDRAAIHDKLDALHRHHGIES